jgi:hypothetical protein
MRHLRALIGFGMLLGAFLTTAPARAAVILSNLPGVASTTGTHLGLGQDGAHRAQAVGVKVGPLPMELRLVTVLITNQDKGAAELSGGVHADAGGSPGPLLASFTAVSVPAFTDAKVTDLTTASTLILSPHASYWFVLRGPATVNHLLWETLIPDTAPVPSPDVTFLGYRHSTNGGGSWSGSSTFNGVRIHTATVVQVGALELADFDFVAFKQNTGESATDTALGVRAVPAPVWHGGVALVLVGGGMPLSIPAGPSDGAVVLFGFIDRAAWLPTDGDGLDLETDWASVGDRLYARLDGSGSAQLVSAPPFSTGVVLGSAPYMPDPDTEWTLEISGGIARLRFGTSVLVESPLAVAGGADPDLLGSDFVINVVASGDTGEATIGRRDGLLLVDGFESGTLGAWSATQP